VGPAARIHFARRRQRAHAHEDGHSGIRNTFVEAQVEHAGRRGVPIRFDDFT